MCRTIRSLHSSSSSNLACVGKLPETTSVDQCVSAAVQVHGWARIMFCVAVTIAHVAVIYCLGPWFGLLVLGRPLWPAV